MIKNNFYFRLCIAGLLLFGALLSSCSDKGVQGCAEIYVDFDEVCDLDLCTQPTVQLEETDESLLGRVDVLLLHKDKIIMRSRGELFVFNRDGSFANKVGQKGNGPADYIGLNSFFMMGDTLLVYDAGALRVLKYSLDNEMLGSVSVSDSYDEVTPNYIIPISGGRLLSRNRFGGEHRSIPTYSILDDGFNIKSSIEGRIIDSGISTFNNFSPYNDYALFWELMNDTIFSVVSETEYMPMYFVDFNSKSIQKIIKGLDIYDALVLSNEPANKDKYASLVGNVHKRGSVLMFTFVYQAAVHLVVYDDNTNVSKVYRLVYDARQPEPLLYYNTDALMVVVLDAESEANPLLVEISYDDII